MQEAGILNMAQHRSLFHTCFLTNEYGIVGLSPSSSPFRRFHLVHGSSDEPSRPEPLRLAYPHTHQLPPRNPKTSLLVFICGPARGSADTSLRGTIFLYMSVNNILIHFGFFFTQSFVLLSFAIVRPVEERKSRESHVNRTLYLHGPSQCKIEILLMEILTKRPFFH